MSNDLTRTGGVNDAVQAPVLLHGAEGRIAAIGNDIDALKAHNAKLIEALRMAREHIPQWPGNPVIAAIDAALEGQP